jgi:hypothetical protein
MIHWAERYVGIVLVLKLRVGFFRKMINWTISERTRGSETPRVCTRTTRCANFIAESLIPTLIFEAHRRSIMRDFTAERVFHAAGLLRLVHLPMMSDS